MCNIADVANSADIIVNGYAFTKANNYIKVLNLNNPEKAAVIGERNDIIETSMDDIEMAIVLDYYNKNRKYLEDV